MAIANLLYKLKESKQAIKYFKMAIQINESSVEAYYGLGLSQISNHETIG